MLVHTLLALTLCAAPGKHWTPVASVEGVSEYDLPNGLKVLLVPDASAPQVTVNLTVLVGSRNEDYGERGMAHLFEHMLFKRTKKIADIKKTLGEMGGNANGSTWYDRTNFFETFPASDQTLKAAIELEAERLTSAIVSREQLATELTVVRNELESGENDPETVLTQRVESSAFIWHNYAHSTIGVRSDIEKVPTERLQAFYEKYYQPDNALLILAGRLEPEQTLSWVSSAFGRIPKPKRHLSLDTYTVEPVQDGERSVTVRRSGGTPVLDALYHVPAGSDPDFPAVDVLAKVLGDSPSGRLYTDLVDGKKAAKTACDTYQNREPGVLHCIVELGSKDPVGVAREAMLSELEGVGKKPVTQAETDRAKASLLKEIELVLNTSERVGLVLSETAALGDWRLLFVYRDGLKAVTAADVNRVAARYLKVSNRTLGEYVPTESPDRAEIPALVDVAPLIKGLKPSDGLAQGEAFVATPQNIESRTLRSALPNGMKLALLPKRTRGGTVHLALRIDYGTLESLTQRRAASLLAAQMLLRGTRTKTHAQFKDALDALQANVQLQPAPQSVMVILEVRRPQLLAALDLLSEALQSPAFDPKEFESLRREVIATAEQQKDEPVSVGFVGLKRMISPYPKGHPFAVASFDEMIAEAKAAQLTDAKDFHAQFYGAQDAKLALIGDFDPAEVTQKLTALFGQWTARKPYQRIARPYQALEATHASLDLPDKANAFYGAALALQMKDTDPDYAAMVMADFMLGGGFLNGRVTQRLREKDGLSYGAGTQLVANGLDDFGALIGYAIYAPQNAAKVETGFREEVERAVGGGFTDAELKSARQGLKQQRAQQLAEDPAVSMQMLEQAEVGRTMLFEADLNARIDALTPAQVGGALKKYVDPSKLATVKVGDFKHNGVLR